MAIIGFTRSAKMGVSAIVGLHNKSDIDEDDLLTFFEQDDTQVIAQHLEDLKNGRAFAEAAMRVSKKKPVIVSQGGPHRGGRQSRKLAYRGARRKRQDLRELSSNDCRAGKAPTNTHALL